MLLISDAVSERWRVLFCFVPQELAGEAGDDDGASWQIDSRFSRLFQRTQTLFRTMSNRTLANICWAFATMGYTGALDLMVRFAPERVCRDSLLLRVWNIAASSQTRLPSRVFPTRVKSMAATGNRWGRLGWRSTSLSSDWIAAMPKTWQILSGASPCLATGAAAGPLPLRSLANTYRPCPHSARLLASAASPRVRYGHLRRHSPRSEIPAPPQLPVDTTRPMRPLRVARSLSRCSAARRRVAGRRRLGWSAWMKPGSPSWKRRARPAP